MADAKDMVLALAAVVSLGGGAAGIATSTSSMSEAELARRVSIEVAKRDLAALKLKVEILERCECRR